MWIIIVHNYLSILLVLLTCKFHHKYHAKIFFLIELPHNFLQNIMDQVLEYLCLSSSCNFSANTRIAIPRKIVTKSPTLFAYICMILYNMSILFNSVMVCLVHIYIKMSLIIAYSNTDSGHCSFKQRYSNIKNHWYDF